jgi:glucose-1-phosphate thymidylyltransferase
MKKGIIISGGMGTRLRPITLVTSKNLLPVFNKPLIMYPIETLKKMGIYDILITTGSEHAGDFMQCLGSGRSFGCNLTYKLQDEAGGIAQALALAKEFVGDDTCAVILGDNIYEDDFKRAKERFEDRLKEQAKDSPDDRSLAMIFLKEVVDPERFGVARFSEDGNEITELLEKPKDPPSNMAQTGLYFYTPDVFNIIKELKPSARGEMEITDVNQEYLDRGRLIHDTVKGIWYDAGTFESLWKASNHFAYKSLNNK